MRFRYYTDFILHPQKLSISYGYAFHVNVSLSVSNSALTLS